MKTIDQLRPPVRPLDVEWSATTLEAILSSHAPTSSPSSKSRRVALVGAVAAAVIGVGGVAFATGLVPGFVTDELDRISSSDLSGVHEVASFSLDSNGLNRSFEIWRGTNNDGMSCTAVLEAGGRFGPQFGGSCGDWPIDAWYDATSESSKIGEVMPESTIFIFGEPEMTGVTDVRVFGEGFDHTVAVDPDTGGYAVAIPELPPAPRGHFATVTFLSADGSVLGVRELSEK